MASASPMTLSPAPAVWLERQGRYIIQVGHLLGVRVWATLTPRIHNLGVIRLDRNSSLLLLLKHSLKVTQQYLLPLARARAHRPLLLVRMARGPLFPQLPTVLTAHMFLLAPRTLKQVGLVLAILAIRVRTFVRCRQRSSLVARLSLIISPLSGALLRSI